MPKLLEFHFVRSAMEGFDWGLGAMRWWSVGRLMLCHYDWTMNDRKGNRWAVLWFTEKARYEFNEGVCK